MAVALSAQKANKMNFVGGSSTFQEILFLCWQIFSKNLNFRIKPLRRLRKNRENTVKHENVQKMVNISLGFYPNAPDFIAHND